MMSMFRHRFASLIAFLHKLSPPARKRRRPHSVLPQAAEILEAKMLLTDAVFLKAVNPELIGVVARQDNNLKIEPQDGLYSSGPFGGDVDVETSSPDYTARAELTGADPFLQPPQPALTMNIFEDADSGGSTADFNLAAGLLDGSSDAGSDPGAPLVFRISSSDPVPDGFPVHVTAGYSTFLQRAINGSSSDSRGTIQATFAATMQLSYNGRQIINFNPTYSSNIINQTAGFVSQFFNSRSESGDAAFDAHIGDTITLGFGSTASGHLENAQFAFLPKLLLNIDYAQPFVPVDIAVTSAQLQNGNTVQFTCQTTGITDSFQVGLYRSTDGITFNPADLISAQPITPDPDSGSETGFFAIDNSQPADPALPYLLVVADPDNVIPETDEGNNQASVPLADIAITSAKIENKNTVQVTFETTGISQPFQLGLYRSPDGVTFNPLNSIDMEPVSPGADGIPTQATFSLANPLAEDASMPYIVVAADPDGAVAESRKDNNEALASVVTATVIQGIPNPSLVGEWVTFLATVTPASLVYGAPTGDIAFEISATPVVDLPATFEIAKLPPTFPGDSSNFVFSLPKPFFTAGDYEMTAEYIPDDVRFGESDGKVTQHVIDLTSDNLDEELLKILPGAELVFDIDDVVQAIDAVDGLKAPTNPVTLDFRLHGGTWDGIVFNPPDKVTVRLIGITGPNVLIGHSPALTVMSGTLIANGLTFTNTTDAPTILVDGGNLVLRNDDVEETTGGQQAAVSFMDGTLDLGTAADLGGNILNVNGLGELVHNVTPDPVPAFGNTFEADGSSLDSPYLSFTAVTSSGSPNAYGETVTLTATVRPNTLPGFGTPSGSVSFRDSTTGAELGLVPLVAGTGVLNTSALAAGSHKIVASYTGDNSFTPSFDSTVFVVDNATPVFSLLRSPTIIVGTNSTTLSGTISLESLVPTGSVTITLNSVGKSVSINSDGTFSALFATEALGVGAYPISYSYNGDQNFNAAADVGTVNVTYNVTTFSGPMQARQAGSTISFYVQLTNANGIGMPSPNRAVMALGMASVGSPNDLLPAGSAGNSNPGNRFLSGSYRYLYNLKTPKNLAAGKYLFYFAIDGDPLVHSLQFEIK